MLYLINKTESTLDTSEETTQSQQTSMLYETFHLR